MQCMAQLAVGGRRGSRGRRGKRGPCERGVAHGSGGTGEWGFCGALQLELVGARCAAPAALLRRESQFPPDACTRRARMQTSEQRADPKGMARALGCGRERRWRAAGKRCNNAAPSRRGVLAAGREGADIFITILRVRGLNNFRGHFFRPGHTCFGLRDRGGQGSFSAAQRQRRPARRLREAIGGVE